MKKTFFILAAVAAIQSNAQNAELVVKQVDNGGIVPGNTYRVFLKIEDPAYNVHAVFGDESDPMSIQTTTSFYQHAWGGYNSGSVNEDVFSIDPAFAFDSWITLGYQNSEGNTMWDLGMNFSDFNNGGSIGTNNGAWFILPTDEKCNGNEDGEILLAQFTSTGIVSGTLNIQGWHGANNNWQARQLTFTTAVISEVASALSGPAEPGTGEVVAAVETVTQNGAGMEIYPNPNRGDFFNLNLEGVQAGKTVVELTNMIGSVVYSSEINVTSSYSTQIRFLNIPAAGVYSVNVTTIDGQLLTQKLIIQ